MESQNIDKLKSIVSVIIGNSINALHIPNKANVIESSLNEHLREVDVWSQRLEFYGISQALNIDESTISLDIALAPRSFVGTNAKREWTENDLLLVDKHYILLGDPGSGKTTTVKRLCLKLLESAKNSDSNDIKYRIKGEN